MPEIAIKVDHLSKLYYIGTQKSGSFRETISNKLKWLAGKANASIAEEFWALNDVSFEIKPGEAVGIIGKNGAGKSTLLKVLSRITQPTRGRIEINGRVASLLEVGTGFHPELSGRENIYLNGTILGMTRREIKAKFDEIVSFSGVEKFIDTPVKHYSSGMYVRLAFAVAAHLDPEILIIDEVLAVGDLEFQKKCLGKMGEVAGEGRTVLFVSHNISAIKYLCSKGIVLKSGTVNYVGEINQSIEKYLINSTVEKSSSTGVTSLKIHPNKKYFKDYGMIEARTYCDGKLSVDMYTGCQFKFEVFINNNLSKSQLVLGFVMKDSFDRELIGINNNHLGKTLDGCESEKELCISYEFALPVYGEEAYKFDLYLGDGVEDYEKIANAFHINLSITDVYHSSKMLNKNLNQIYVPDIRVEAQTLVL